MIQHNNYTLPLLPLQSYIPDPKSSSGAKAKLWYMNLTPFETGLDKLLEDLVAHHEEGSAQRKLVQRLGGVISQNSSFCLCKEMDEAAHCFTEEEPAAETSNLSEKFVDTWNHW